MGDTYDSLDGRNLALASLRSMMMQHDATKIYVKKLASNDNSKNQIYLAGHLTDLSFIKTIWTQATDTKSIKTKDPKRQIKYLLGVDFNWLTPAGLAVNAPNAKLVYYPQYPEVRFSGFLRGATGIDASKWMDRYECGTAEGRWLVVGIGKNKKVFGYLATPGSRIAIELESASLTDTSSVFWLLNDETVPRPKSSRQQLLEKLLDIHLKGVIPSQKLSTKTNRPEPYTAPNGGGYTLEAELSVLPNGDASPDYLGWEVKQFGIKRFPNISPDITTLLTPEPDGGVYVSEGLPRFMHLYGYPPKNGTPHRINFGGIHKLSKTCQKTGLTLTLFGYDVNTQQITDATGYLGLIDRSGNIAASWSFPKLLEHWKRKHAKAVYVPCLKTTGTAGGVGYAYGSEVELGEGTTFEQMLNAYVAENIYYDPGIKIEDLNTPQPKAKKRNQFRIKHKDIYGLYTKFETVSLLSL